MDALPPERPFGNPDISGAYSSAGTICIFASLPIGHGSAPSRRGRPRTPRSPEPPAAATRLSYRRLLLFWGRWSRGREGSEAAGCRAPGGPRLQSGRRRLAGGGGGGGASPRQDCAGGGRPGPGGRRARAPQPGCASFKTPACCSGLYPSLFLRGCAGAGGAPGSAAVGRGGKGRRGGARRPPLPQVIRSRPRGQQSGRPSAAYWPPGYRSRSAPDERATFPVSCFLLLHLRLTQIQFH